MSAGAGRVRRTICYGVFAVALDASSASLEDQHDAVASPRFTILCKTRDEWLASRDVKRLGEWLAASRAEDMLDVTDAERATLEPVAPAAIKPALTHQSQVERSRRPPPIGPPWIEGHGRRRATTECERMRGQSGSSSHESKSRRHWSRSAWTAHGQGARPANIEVAAVVDLREQALNATGIPAPRSEVARFRMLCRRVRSTSPALRRRRRPTCRSRSSCSGRASSTGNRQASGLLDCRVRSGARRRHGGRRACGRRSHPTLFAGLQVAARPNRLR